MSKASRKKAVSVPIKAPSLKATSKQLLGDIRDLIEASRGQVAQAVNAGLVLLYWHIGERIRQDILGQERAEYGQRIIEALAQQLTAEWKRIHTGHSFPHGAIRRKIPKD